MGQRRWGRIDEVSTTPERTNRLSAKCGCRAVPSTIRPGARSRTENPLIPIYEGYLGPIETRESTWQKMRELGVDGRLFRGYTIRDRKLHINPEEAGRVREIFRQYLRLRTVTALKAHLDQSTVRSKIHVEHGERVGGKFSRGALYKILRNHIYVGEIAHKGAASASEVVQNLRSSARIH
jgi:hypothetical protein